MLSTIDINGDKNTDGNTHVKWDVQRGGNEPARTERWRNPVPNGAIS